MSTKTPDQTKPTPPAATNTTAGTTLDLTTLTSRMPWLEGYLVGLVDAARMMLSEEHEDGRATGRWTHDNKRTSVEVSWVPADERITRIYGNRTQAIERGACAVAIAAVDTLGFKVQGESFQGSQSDYWMTRRDEPESTENVHKLEVSGIGDGGSPGARLAEKVAQGLGGWKRPGLACVVRFSDVKLLSESWT